MSALLHSRRAEAGGWPLRAVLTVLKVLALLIVIRLALLQIPELAYDLGPKTPIEIDSPDDLAPERFTGSTFVAVTGTPDLTRLVRHGRHGILFHYFNLKPFGMRLVVRSYERPTEEWDTLTRFVGRLKPFAKQPFDGTLRERYRTEFNAEVPEQAYVLYLYDVPRVSGWQVGALIYAVLLLAGLIYIFFIRKKRRRPRATGRHSA
ncbi:MAG: hypothetical protein GF393_03265 [Armatimonadia bacterium]|nr:hypothetical protein [Armatimonadia bacterium]